MKIHLVIIQPAGYIHSLGFLDSARFLRYQFRRLGYEATIGKNRALPDAINIVFGAHLGFPESWERDCTCVIFNQEQLGAGGAALPPAYMELLRRSHVLDYDAANMPAYGDEGEKSGLLRAVAPLLCAPYLHNANGAMELEDRPIDLLFIGSMNQARQQLISRIESCGVAVSHFDHPMYGPERDHYVSQSKAVLNIPFYESTRFEQTRVFNSLSVGTPVVSLRRPNLIVDQAFERAVHWFEDEGLENFFALKFNTDEWFRLSREYLTHWRVNDGYSSYQALAQKLIQLAKHTAMAFGHCGADKIESITLESKPRVITRLNLSPERGYRPEWVNAGAVDSGSFKDIILDLDSLKSSTQIIFGSDPGVRYALIKGELTKVYLFCHHGGLPSPSRLMAILDFLAPQGSLIMDVSLGVFPSMDQRPNLAFAMSEGQVRLLLDEILRLDCRDNKLALSSCELTNNSVAIDFGEVWLGRFTLTNSSRTPRERVLARMVRDDFSGLPEDT